MNLPILVIVVSSTTSSLPPTEFIPLIQSGNLLVLKINVTDAEKNPQRVVLDTGSKHSWLILSEVNGGFRESAIMHSVSLETENMAILYTSLHVFLQKWARREFRSSGHVWDQKFAVALLPYKLSDRWVAYDRTGLLGASPNSRFAKAHPHFGIIPRENGRKMYFFINQPLSPILCRGAPIVYADVTSVSAWFISISTLSLGGLAESTFEKKFQVLVDTGASTIIVPQGVFDVYKQQLEKLLPSSMGIIPCAVHGEMITLLPDSVHLVPDLILTLAESGATIRISNTKLVKCKPTVCVLSVVGHAHSSKIILGSPLFKTHIVEFDTSIANHPNIKFCETIPDDSGDEVPLAAREFAADEPQISLFRLPNDLVEDPDDPPKAADQKGRNTLVSLSISTTIISILILCISF